MSCGWASNSTVAARDRPARKVDHRARPACDGTSADPDRCRRTTPPASGRAPPRAAAGEAVRRRAGTTEPGTRARGARRRRPDRVAGSSSLSKRAGVVSGSSTCRIGSGRTKSSRGVGRGYRRRRDACRSATGPLRRPPRRAGAAGARSRRRPDSRRSRRRSTYEFTEVPATDEAMARYVAWLLALRDANDAVPFAQRLILVGTNRRVHEVDGAALVARPPRARRGRDRRDVAGRRRPAHGRQHGGQAAPAHPRLRVSGTSTASPWRPTSATSAAAGDRPPRRHVRGHPAQSPAVEGAGEDGLARNTALFSITAAEWPAVRQRLSDALARRLTATAISPATAALCSARARLAGTLPPAVAAAIRPSTNGVTAAPVDAARVGVAEGLGERLVDRVGVELGLGRDRTATSTPTSRVRAANTAATVAASSTRCGTGRPVDRV